jgi:hypothetical protein
MLVRKCARTSTIKRAETGGYPFSAKRPESGFLLKAMRHFQISQETPRYCVAKSKIERPHGRDAGYTCAG